MAIDMEALRIASQGEPDDKVTVKRRWLREVYRALSDHRVKAGTAKARDGMENMSRVFADVFSPRYRGQPGDRA